MKLVTYTSDQGPRPGIIQKGWVVDLWASWRASPREKPLPEDLLAILAQGPGLLKKIGAMAAEGRLPQPVRVPLAEARLKAPLPKPGKIIGVARNYHDWLAQAGMRPPKEPTLFSKTLNTVVGPGEAIVLPELSNKVSYEAEVAVVLGSTGRNIQAQQAMSYVAGYTIINDVSAVDLIKHDGNMFRGKNLDTFAPMGPALVTADEVPDPHHLRIRLSMNGKCLQDSSTALMVMKIPELISYISRDFTLEPGDIIASGTPGGTAGFHSPPAFLARGSELQISIEKLGVLRNPVTK